MLKKACSGVIYRYDHDDQNHQNRSFESSHRSKIQGQTVRYELVSNPSYHIEGSCNDRGDRFG